MLFSVPPADTLEKTGPCWEGLTTYCRKLRCPGPCPLTVSSCSQSLKGLHVVLDVPCGGGAVIHNWEPWYLVQKVSTPKGDCVPGDATYSKTQQWSTVRVHRTDEAHFLFEKKCPGGGWSKPLMWASNHRGKAWPSMKHHQARVSCCVFRMFWDLSYCSPSPRL